MEYLIAISTGLILLLTYRKGLRDGIEFSKTKQIKPIKPIKTIKKNFEENAKEKTEKKQEESITEGIQSIFSYDGGD